MTALMHVMQENANADWTADRPAAASYGTASLLDQLAATGPACPVGVEVCSTVADTCRVLKYAAL